MKSEQGANAAVHQPLELLVLSAGAPKAGLVPCAKRLLEVSGTVVDFRFETAPTLRKLLEAEMGCAGSTGAGALVAPRALISDLVRAGFLAATSVVPVGGIKTAACVRRGSGRPDIRTVEALRSSLRAAPHVVVNRASSGSFVEGVLRDLGLEADDPKLLRVDTGREVIDYVADAKQAGVIGFAQMTEIRRLSGRGVELLGPLPGPLGNTTWYEACVLPVGAQDPGAQLFVDFLASPDAKNILTGVGIE